MNGFRLKAAQFLVRVLTPEHTLLPPAYERVEIRRKSRGISCGSGPERVSGLLEDNPNWYRNLASNAIAVAEELDCWERSRP